MLRPLSIKELSKNEVRKLVNWIDFVFFDIDGVLLFNKTCLPGAKDGVALLRKLGKNILFVSNNPLYPLSLLVENLKPFGATEDEIVTPNDALLAYLKKTDIKKDIYVICGSLTKKLLKEAGYSVIEYKDIHSGQIEESVNAIRELYHKTLEVCKNVGFVYVDLDFNFCMQSIQVATFILEHIRNVDFLTGPHDDRFTVNENIRGIGTEFYIEAIERWTKRKSITMAKPGLAIKDVLNSRVNVSDVSRVLFIGDNAAIDIAFGSNCGFKTCLVFSGVTSKNQVEDGKLLENFKPTYTAESFGELYEKIKDL